MAPNITSTSTVYENDAIEKPMASEINEKKQAAEYRVRIVWRNVVIFGYLHIVAVYGLYLIFTSAKWQTVLFAFLLYQASGLGITAGAHRLWSHRSYKAKWQLRLILMVFNNLAFQNSIFEWARDHRVHHKFSETDADPHNAKRGFFFSHVGWLLCQKHPDVITKGQKLDMSDLMSDPIVAFQHKYYMFLMPLFCFILPAVIPAVFWGESLLTAFCIDSIFRYVFTLNMTWLVNSAAHMFGNKPYDKFINPAENKGVAIGALGEGWHNYHHVFPWDYKTSELGDYKYNTTTAFIDFFAKIGWAYDLKTIPSDIVKKRVQKTGDGTHEVWGWGDKDQSQEDKEETIVLNYCRQRTN